QGAGPGDCDRRHDVPGLWRTNRPHAVWRCLHVIADRRREAAENGINVYQMNKHYEVAPIMSLTEHEANNNVIWVSDKVWNSLTDEQKRWVQAAADEVGRTMPDKSFGLEHDSMARLEKMGVKFVKDVDKSGF